MWVIPAELISRDCERVRRLLLFLADRKSDRSWRSATSLQHNVSLQANAGAALIRDEELSPPGRSKWIGGLAEFCAATSSCLVSDWKMKRAKLLWTGTGIA
ncbi:hypothetical protein AVEN_116602-1 [Araneus ventricosus]|uniref:Uncharacterized protein n=1 Tax=Araneus ventricosus TaxID=182803 RepID=A0A4Y2DH94_ARAVE|nr:hypothetical protein AVEN_116602-1 [Araneus ventricosus]